MSNIDLPIAARQFIEEFIQWSADIKTVDIEGEILYDAYPSLKYLTRAELLEYYLNVVRQQQL